MRQWLPATPSVLRRLAISVWTSLVEKRTSSSRPLHIITSLTDVLLKPLLKVLPFFISPKRQTRIRPSLSPSVFFHLATGFLTLSPPRFAFSPHLASHALTVATTLLNVRIVLALFEEAIVTALLPTERDRLAFGL